MPTTTVRIREETRQVLRALARDRGVPISTLIAEAVEALRRQHLLEQTNAAYASARENAAAWEAEEQERRVWEAALADGMEGQ